MLRRNTSASENAPQQATSEPRGIAKRAVERVETSSPAETEALGARLARPLRPGDVVLVAGDLGAGKTTLVRGACRELGVTVPVTSPTFTIGQQYPGPVPISHIDLFRIDHLAEEEPELLADYLGPDTIAFVEWPPTAPSESASLGRIVRRVRIEHAGGDRRLVAVE